MKVGDRVHGKYNEWIDHPHNYFQEHDYSGKIVGFKNDKPLVKTKSQELGTIIICPEDGDTIQLKDK